MVVRTLGRNENGSVEGETMRTESHKKPTKTTATTKTPKTVAHLTSAGSIEATSLATDGGMGAKATTYEARMRALAPVVRIRRKLEATALRFSNIASEVKRWKNAPDLGETASKVETTLAAMLADAATMPDSFRPERERKRSSRQLTSGTKVVLREKAAAKYAGIFEQEAGTTLEVVSVTRAHVSVKTAAGTLVVLPRAHVAKSDQL